MTTTLTFYYFNSGIADGQAVEQFTEAFDKFVAAKDPGWGDVAIAAGMHGNILIPHKADLNLYWWWSGSDREDWLEYYCANVTVKTAAILCTSRKMYDHSIKHGFRAIYLPIGFGHEFKPLNIEREGVGFCGAPGGHKPAYQEQVIIEPAKRYDFTWRTHVDGGRVELNEWYNSLAVVLGMAAEITQSWGIVPSRTYEVLAGANPYIVYRHSGMEDELGFDYPYQSDTVDDTIALIEEFTNNFDEHKKEFELYASLMRRYHTWERRVEMLRDGLEKI